MGAQIDDGTIPIDAVWLAGGWVRHAAGGVGGALGRCFCWDFALGLGLEVRVGWGCVGWVLVVRLGSGIVLGESKLGLVAGGRIGARTLRFGFWGVPLFVRYICVVGGCGCLRFCSGWDGNFVFFFSCG